MPTTTLIHPSDAQDFICRPGVVVDVEEGKEEEFTCRGVRYRMTTEVPYSGNYKQ